MASARDEARRLRAVVLRNAQGLLRARRLAEDDLRRQSEWLRGALASIGDAVISIDVNGCVSCLNDVAQSLTLWTHAQALRHPLPNVFRIVDEHTRQEAPNPALRALGEGTPIGPATHILIAKNGTERPIDDSAVPIRSADGRILGAVLIFRDVAGRHRAERALRDSEERLRLATSAAHLGIWVWHVAEDRITWDRERTPDIFRLPPASMPGQLDRLKTDFLHAEDRPVFEAALSATVDAGADALHFVGRLHRADGALRWIEMTGRLQPTTGGERDTIVGTVADVTDREQAQEQIRYRAEANAKFRSIFDQGAQFASILSVEGIVLEVNRLSLEACGFERSDVVGKRFWECGWWNRSITVMELVRAACARAARGDLFRTETPYFLADGTERHMLLTIAAVTDDDGRILFLSPTGTDITDRRAAQDALRESEQRFRLAEAEREALLASERAARADAERASFVREEFLAMLSHELRTPLNAILGWTQVLRREPPTSQTLVQGLAVIDRNARMQAQLIADLLDMSLIMSGKMRIDPERVELRVVIEAALESVRASADAKGVTIASALSPIAATISGDPMRLQQVVWNLLTNAIKFTPAGGHVRVTLGQVDSHVEISVHDTGKGIASEFLPHVFERFRQAETSSAREHRGLGLGLAIVKQLVDAHGGRVDVTSDGDGKGSTFTVRLPVTRPQGTGDTLDGHSSATQFMSVQYDPPNLGGVTVLAVDDDPDARDLIGRMLRECGARVLLAGSTNEALSAMEHERLDVIVSDIAMPVRDGYAFMTTVRRMGIRTPAVALSAFARTEDRRRSLQAGFQTHVSKPVEPAELVAIVAALAHKAVGSTHAGDR